MSNLIEPAEVTRPDVLAFYAMPIVSDMKNTGDRLKATADKVGIPIIASDLFLQKKKMIFDMAAREANQPSGKVFEDASKRRTESFLNAVEHFGLSELGKLGMGDSLGVPAIQGMQLHGEEKPFNAILLRDGWNLSGPASTGAGLLRYAGYQVRNEIAKRVTGEKFDIPKTPYSDVPVEESETSLLETLQNVSDMMRGPEGRHNAMVLASMTGFVMNVVCLRSGLSGTPSQQTEFTETLTSMRDSANEFFGNPSANDFRAEVVEGWHSALLDPARAANDIENTLALVA